MTNWKNDPDVTGPEEPGALEMSLGELPTEARVPTHLWRGIRERMDRDSSVGEPGTGPGTGSRRFSLSAAQMVAAGLILSFLSGGAVWIALTVGADPSAGVGPPLPTAGQVVTAAGQPEYASPGAIQQYQAAIAELEAVLQEGRSVLGDATIRTIEESLSTIDQAIAEATSALAQDPGNELLSRLLTRTLVKKMDILKQTAVTIRVRST